MAVTRETSTGKRLRVRVNDDLMLDAGTCEEVSGPYGPEWQIRPPETSMFHQALDHLRAKPDPLKCSSGSIVGRGTGRLQEAVREFLGEDPRVTSFAFAPHDEGGTGVSKVKLPL